MKSIAYSKTDEQFLEKLNGIILEHISDPELDVNQIAELMHISRPTLYRKIREISEMTPNDLIRITRLKRAAELLLQSDMKIYEIAEAVGSARNLISVRISSASLASVLLNMRKEILKKHLKILHKIYTFARHGLHDKFISG